MTSHRTAEGARLKEVESYITQFVACCNDDADELRLQVLEATSAVLGGFDFDSYRSTFQIAHLVSVETLISHARRLAQLIDETSIHPALCLSILARESLNDSERRHNGAYHTDSMLALHLAHTLESNLHEGAKVLDPACGAGILLTAISIVACRSDYIHSRNWLRNSIYAADLSSTALRGTRLALASLTNDIQVIESMVSGWRVHDSLLEPDITWQALCKDGFDIVIANPPWEKIKLSRHEYLKANGDSRKYGSNYRSQSLSGYEFAKSQRSSMARSLIERYPVLTKGDPDLYVAFTELLYKVTRPGGYGALLVPAGLIRSLNTKELRKELICGTEDLTLTVMENRARHFAIDTRFKFLVVKYKRKSTASAKLRCLNLSHATVNGTEIIPSPPVRIPLKTLEMLRPDLTVPEVRSAKEWHLYRKMQMNGELPSKTDSYWYPTFCREVDMTHGRRYFVRQPTEGLLPVIEGRMVQPHRLGCKIYVSGEGRSAVWRNLAPGLSKIRPQFWLPEETVSDEGLARSGMYRAGFCDITGQTNERSMMASLIPPGVTCGNKVPTVIFPNDLSKGRLYLWLAIVNSIPFDWLIRRVITTTVNYFVLLSVAMPRLNRKSHSAQRLIAISRKLRNLDLSGKTGSDKAWQIAELRAEADILVAKAYGCSADDIILILRDFPLLDRCQPALPGMTASSITSDYLMSMWHGEKNKMSPARRRVNAARELGAVPYICSEFSQCIFTDSECVGYDDII